jgi:chorismate-pyruvate lyase
MRNVKVKWKPKGINRIGENKKNLRWIHVARSLTNELKKASREKVIVKTLEQKLLFSSKKDNVLLPSLLRKYSISREVLILSGDTPWILAQSTIVPTASHKNLRFLIKKLEHKGLGEIIFKTSSQCSRSFLQMNNNPFYIKKYDLNSKFSRRSLLKWRGLYIIITEYFLDTFQPN